MALLSHLEGSIDVDRLASAFDSVVNASDSLRTRIAEVNARTIVEIASFDISRTPFTTTIDLDRDEASTWAGQRVRSPIDPALSSFDSVILRHEDGTCSWYLALHHTVTDATSSALVFNATAAAYHGEQVVLPPYQRWAAEQAVREHTAREKRARAHWSSRDPAPVLPGLYRPVSARLTDNERLSVDLGDGLLASVEAGLDGPYRMLSADLAWTTFLVTALSIHLHRITGAEQFSIGVPIHNRSGAEASRLVGPLMEVYPVDVTVDPSRSIAELHRDAGRSLLRTVGKALPDVGASAADVSAIVNVISSFGLGSFGPIPSTTEWIHPGAADPNHLAGLQLTTYGSDRPALFLDLNVAATADRHRRRAPGHLRRIIEAMVADPSNSVLGFALVDEEERASLSDWGNGVLLDSDRHRFDSSRATGTGLVLERLEAALVDRHEPALVDGSTTLSGSELWARSGGVGRRLRAEGIAIGDRVAIEMPRSADAVIAIIGVLRAGASYVPIDPDQPASRRDRIAERSGAVLRLTELPAIEGSESELERPVQPDTEAYVLFTSGSTGEPKGVPILHGGLADYLAFALEEYVDSTAAPIAPLFTALTFDLTVTSLFLPLIAGGRLDVIRPGSTAGLRAVAGHEDLNWMKATPSHLAALRRLLPPEHPLRTIVVGGEAFPSRLAEDLVAAIPSVRLFNEYGPTEAVVGCMIHEYAAGAIDHNVDSRDVPIGRPAPGVALAIVDPGGNLSPEGAPGELLIASPGVTPGYLGVEPDDHPFEWRESARFYHSGDLVRLDQPDSATFLGRTDEQIKVNGIRLEPAEVVAAIEEHPAVTRAVVRLWSVDTDRSILAAWYETDPSEPDSPPPAIMRSFLLSRLPSHQIPVGYAAVSSLAFNVNGKLDTDALPVPERVRSSPAESGDEVAWSATELAIRTAWRAVLGLDDVGRNDDFFVLGGDSLAALEAAAALTQALDFDVPEGLVFNATTLADMAAAIDNIEVRTLSSAPTRRPAGDPPDLSAGERAMLFEYRLRPDSIRYNIGRRYRIQGPVEADRLRAAVEAVTERHEPLRWTYAARRRELALEDALAWSESSEPLDEAHSRVAAQALYRETFDLENGPLLKAERHELSDGSTAFVLVVHHISGDAGSLDRLWTDIERAYLGALPGPLPISYADHASWQAARDVHGDYWAGLWERGANTDLGLLPPLVESSDGYIEQPASFTARELRACVGSTPTATVLAALVAVMEQYSPTGRHAVGVTASTRDHEVAQPLVGYTLNTLPLILEVDGSRPFASAAVDASRLLGEALPRRSHPYAEMLAAARRNGRPEPAPRILLSVEDLAPATLGPLSVEHEILASGEAVTDASVFVQIRGDRVDLGIEFAGRVMNEARARLFLDDLDVLVRVAIDEPHRPLDRIALPSAALSVVHGPALESRTDVLTSITQWFDRPPGNVAVVGGEDQVTWAELDGRSARLAASLASAGVHRGDHVVLAVPRSVDLIVGMLGILRAGAAYVPIDPSYPAERVQRIATASSAAIAVVGPGIDLPGLTALPVSPSDPMGKEKVAAPQSVVDSADPETDAYVIFTSGSTGRPKGVAVTHGQLATSTNARHQFYDDAPDRFLLLSSIGFDSSVVGIFWTLASGGTIVVPTDAEVHDPDAILSLISRHTISHVLLVPSLYRPLLERGRASEHWPSTVIVAGEACTSALVDRHHDLRGATALVNEYGPTEATVWSSAHRCHPGEHSVPIGRPIAGSWMAVARADGTPAPLGAAGELVIGGAGVTRGYLDPRDDSDRFSPSSPLGTGRTYATGDRCAAVFDADGAVTFGFIGRLDDQLNVGGLRLEPGDVERVLTEHRDVGDAVVVASEDPEPALVAHVEAVDFAAGAGAVDLSSLRAAIADALPAAARPRHYVIHERLPRTPNGKIDRRSLAEAPLPIEQSTARADGAANAVRDGQLPIETSDPVLRQVIELFRRHLRRDDIGPDDDFFVAGGDSLAALSLVMELEEQTNEAYSVTALLSEPTARAVARGVSATMADDEQTKDTRFVEWIRSAGAGSGPDTDAAQPVLVLLAPGSGHLVGYQPLINALDSTLAIVGVRLPGYDGKEGPERTVAAQADRVESELLEVLAGRRAVLFGGSSGGLLGWELQHRAERDGRPYETLVMQDTIHPDALRETAELGGVARYLDIRRREGVVAAGSAVLDRIRQRLDDRNVQKRAAERREAGGPEDPEAAARRMFAAANELSRSYRPLLVQRPVVFLAAQDTDPRLTIDRWADSSADFRSSVFEGAHFGEDGITSSGRVAPVAEFVMSEMRALVGRD